MDDEDEDGYAPSNMAFPDLSLPEETMEFKLKFRIKRHGLSSNYVN